MIMDSLGPTLRVGIAQGPFVIDHDQDVLDPLTSGPLVEFGEILAVARLILEELVDVFAGSDAILALGDHGEVQVLHFIAEEGPVQRPLRQ